MKQTFIQLSRFVAKWRSLRLNDTDLSALESLLMDKPDRGDAMAGTGGVRKVRFAPPSRHTGKSVLTIFGKNEQENFTAAQKAEFRTLMKVLEKYHKGK